MRRRTWKSLAAWILIAVLCAGSLPVSASGIDDTGTGNTTDTTNTNTTDTTETTDTTAGEQKPAAGGTDETGGGTESSTGTLADPAGEPSNGNGTPEGDVEDDADEDGLSAQTLTASGMPSGCGDVIYDMPFSDGSSGELLFLTLADNPDYRWNINNSGLKNNEAHLDTSEGSNCTFRLTHVENQWYGIKFIKDGGTDRYVDVDGKSTKEGAVLHIFEDSDSELKGNEHRQFAFYSAGPDSAGNQMYYIQIRKSGLWVGLENNKIAKEQKLVQTSAANAKKWYITPCVVPKSGEEYGLWQNGNKRVYCEIFESDSINSASIFQKKGTAEINGMFLNTFNIGTYWRWLLTYVPKYDAYMIESVNQYSTLGVEPTNNVWDVIGESGGQAGLNLWEKQSKDRNYNTSQLWRFIGRSAESLVIQNARSGQYVYVNSSDFLNQGYTKQQFEVSLLSTEASEGTSAFLPKGADSGGCDWMANIPNSALLSSINIPGTHDTGTGGVTEDRGIGGIGDTLSLTQCQKYYYEEQLTTGIRSLDVRCSASSDTATAAETKIVHGSDTWKCYNRWGKVLTLEEILNTSKEFLAEHPTEAIVMMVAKNDGSEKGMIHALADYISKNKNLFWQTNSHSVPTMKEARGKIVLVSRFNVGDTDVDGIDETWFGPQLDDWDDFDYGSTEGLINISSDSGYKAYAQDAYNELSSNGTKQRFIQGAIIDSSGSSIPGDAYIWNFTSSALAFPQEIARDINPWLWGFDDLLKQGRMGMVMLNFEDIKLSRKIWETNYDADFFTADCTFPESLTVTYGDTMAEATMNGQEGDGTFTIVEEDLDYRPKVSDAGVKKVTVCFTPSDSRMKTVKQEVTITSVRPREISVTVPAQTFEYGQEVNLIYDVNEAQLAEGDTVESLKISLALDTDQKSGSGYVPVGSSYQVKCSGSNENYSYNFSHGNVEIKAKKVTLTWSKTTNITVNQPDKDTWDKVGANVQVDTITGVIKDDDCSVTVTGGDEKNPSWTGDTSKAPKKYTAVASLTGADAGNYQIATGSETKDYYIRRPGSEDCVFPDSATLVYGQKFGEAVLNGASGDGEFFIYEYNESITTTLEARQKEVSNDAVKCIGEVTGYGVWFVPKDHAERGEGKPIKVYFQKKPITVVINDATRQYGNSVDYTHGEIAWAFNDDDTYPGRLVITLTAKDSDGKVVTETTPVGTYCIDGTAESDYYEVTFQTGKLKITRREVKLSWSGYQNLTYNPNGNANVTAALTEDSLVDDDECTVKVVNGTRKNAGTYNAIAVRLEGEDSYNYKLTKDSNLSQEYTIAKATPNYANVTATLTYGQTLAEATIQGAVTYPTNESVVSGSFEFSGGSSTMPIAADSGTSKYTLTFHPDDTTNYNEVQIKDYQLTVSPKPVTVQMLDREKIYGDELSADAFVSYDETELVGTDRLTIIPTATDAKGSTGVLDPTYINAGTYTISADPGQLQYNNPNYAITVQEGSLTVQQRPVILEWSDVTNIVYQENDTAHVTASIKNLVKKADGTTYDDCHVVVEGGEESGPSRSENSEESLNIYYAEAVRLEGTASGNYIFSEELPEKPYKITDAYYNSRLQPYVIRRSDECIFPAAVVLSYGDGFEDARMLAGSGDGTFEIVDAEGNSIHKKDQKLDAGIYENKYKVKFIPREGSGSGSSDISAYITLVVRKVPLTVVAEDASKTYGDGKPNYKWTITSGELAEWDKQEKLLTAKSVIYDYEEDKNGNIVVTGEISGDKKTSDVNIYDIVLEEQLNKNYDLTFIGAKLTINPKEITVVWSDTSNIVYGYVDGKKNLEKWQEVGANVTATAGGLVNGDTCNLTCSGGNRTIAGTYWVAVTGLDNPNYCLPSYKNVTEYQEKRMTQYEILKADPEAVFPKELNAYKGDVLGGLTFEASADVPGTFTFEAADTVLGESGTYKMIFTPDDLQNYNIVEAMVKINVLEKPSDDDGNGGGGNNGTNGGTGTNGTGGAGAGKTGGTKTSDNAPLLPYVVLALLSLSVVMMTALRKKKR